MLHARMPFARCSQYLSDNCPAWSYGVLDNLGEVVADVTSESAAMLVLGLFAKMGTLCLLWMDCVPTRCAHHATSLHLTLPIVLPLYQTWCPPRMSSSTGRR